MKMDMKLAQMGTKPGTGRRFATVSIVVPFLDECETLEILYDRVRSAMDATGRHWEMIFVDDGSRDGGHEIIARLAEDNPNVTLIRFMRNFGKSAALSAGIQQARGEAILTMDADLQDDPNEIPRFLEKLEEGHDVVSGWKQVRHDPVGKTLPSSG